MKTSLKAAAFVLALSALVPAYAGPFDSTATAEAATVEAVVGTPDEKEKKAPAAASANVSKTKTMGVAIYQSINTSKMNLLIENYIEVPLKVQLLNEKNEVLHAEKVNRNLKTFWRKFEMKDMKDGVYTFEVSDGYNVIQKSFRLETPKENVVKLPERFITFN